jgi:hypothetical protein
LSKEVSVAVSQSNLISYFAQNRKFCKKKKLFRAHAAFLIATLVAKVRTFFFWLYFNSCGCPQLGGVWRPVQEKKGLSSNGS